MLLHFSCFVLTRAGYLPTSDNDHVTDFQESTVYNKKILLHVFVLRETIVPET